ncbi:hypothetical protein ABIE33_003499 [Ensifer sp. 4252]
MAGCAASVETEVTTNRAGVILSRRPENDRHWLGKIASDQLRRAATKAA